MDGSVSMPTLSTPGISASDIAAGRTGAAAKAGVAKAGTPKADVDDKAVAKAAGEFEAQFVSQMLTQMWQGIETDGYFGGGNGEEMFRGLMINEYGKKIAQSGQLGIADNVRHAMLKMQEV
jgi:flagellar protein FlgJ